MNKISFVIPVYNRRGDLPRCLESITSLSGNYEIIAVDDASTDGSYELLQGLNIPHLKVYRNPVNKGVNYTRNRGIECATGKYVFFLDSDDKLFDGGLDTILKWVEAHEEVRHFMFYTNTSPTSSSSSVPYATRYQEWLTENIFGDFSHVVERETLLQFPFFEQFRAFENLNWLRIFKSTEPQMVVPEVVTWVDIDRTDNLTKTLKLKSTAAIADKFQYLTLYFQLYGPELYALDPALYRAKLRHAVLLGIAAGKKAEARALIEACPLPEKGLYKALVAVTPSIALNKLLILK